MTTPRLERAMSHGALDALIRAGLIAALVVICFRIFHPFLNFMLWSVILAVMLYPLHRMLRARLGNRDGRAATIIVLLGVVLMAVPVYLLGVSIAESARNGMAMVHSGNFHIAPPPEKVADVPVVGPKLHAAWTQASSDLTGLVKKFLPQIKSASLGLLGKVAGFSLGLLMFLGSLIVAGIIMAWGEAGHRSSIRIASRIFGPARGESITQLCVATIRAVAQGVVGIALIQMLLVGAGFVLMGVPGAGLLALAVLLLGIMQLPATLITLPVIAYVLATQGASVGTIVFSVYVFVAGLIDNVLKPLLLGRGVSVPMPVVLIGALGGMVTGGILGLFIGPVMLAVGYELFWQWVAQEEPAAPAAALAPEVAAGTPAPAAI
jgi:predicted PurR-regulated permease PerM